MSWSLLFAVLVEMFKAVLPFLEDLFKKSALNPKGEVTVNDRAAVSEAFAAARAQTWVWQWGRRALLNRAERVALDRCGEIALAARHGSGAPLLSVEEGLNVING